MRRLSVAVLLALGTACGGNIPSPWSPIAPTIATVAPAPQPPPTPPSPTSVPPPSPSPTPTGAFSVWGGPNYAQYLGVLTCMFCSELSSDSINNKLGTYGSPLSATSIRNPQSQYGSPLSGYSACNTLAAQPPRAFNASHSVYYGELTINPLRQDAIKTTNVIGWLTGDVCRH